MELRLFKKIFCISLIKDIFGLHDITPLLTCRRVRHKGFITRSFVRKKAAVMIELDMHTSCGSLKPLADIWDGSFLDSWNLLYMRCHLAQKNKTPSQNPVLAGMDRKQRDTREKKPTVKPLTLLKWNPLGQPDLKISLHTFGR